MMVIRESLSFNYISISLNKHFEEEIRKKLNKSIEFQGLYHESLRINRLELCLNRPWTIN